MDDYILAIQGAEWDSDIFWLNGSAYHRLYPYRPLNKNGDFYTSDNSEYADLTNRFNW